MLIKPRFWNFNIKPVELTRKNRQNLQLWWGAAKSNIKKISLELGGKSPCVILNDVDLDAAVDAANDAIFVNAGQVCCAGSRQRILF